MDAVQLAQLAGLIYNHCGIDYRKNLSSLEIKINGRLKELGLSCWEYHGYLLEEPEEWDALIELITVNETFFYREENLLEEFQKVILPQYKERTSENPLIIWCAACSSGEEPYTLGMLVEDSGLFEPGAVKIIASDINKKVLNKGINALYSKKSFSFRNMPEEAYEKFFIDQGDAYQVKQSIRQMVEFRHINLLDKTIVEKMENLDIIVCRNVLIYFDHQAIQTIIHKFYKILRPGGLLLLGHSESLLHYNHPFETIYTDTTFYYRKA